jgi:leucyl/phenylalanyl-tRNA---protein transferase
MNRKLCWIGTHDPLPDTSLALTLQEGANGLLAAGTDLSPQRLLEAYSKGVFPWFSEGEPVLWWTPSPRMVLMLDEFKVSKSLRKDIRKTLSDSALSLVTNRDFAGVMRACAQPRQSGDGTWISEPMISAYASLHAKGVAHSIEVLHNGLPIGGLYCVSLGAMVFGESMFSRQPGASKIALAGLVAWLKRQGGLVIDCQQRTAHLASLGGREIERPVFESHVRELSARAPLPWSCDPPTTRDLAHFLSAV